MDYYNMKMVKEMFEVIRGDMNQSNTNFDKVLLEMTRMKEENKKLILQVTKQDKRIFELERVVRMNTVIMKGTADNENEKESDTREIISKTVQKIGVNVDNAKDIVEIKRIGRFIQEKARPIFLKVEKEQTKSRILKNAKALRGFNIWTEENYPRSVREERRNLIT
ncbi:hypothetical protein ILUMI_02669 [Ignelater luminosus]|uniref:Uncharacterized protein n=1 Tax=Ignelater luminosus TaxID=2038154 RepID=A0A8K0DC64_IGNLU|nr:hypothetical protein ILUMI_02669 [Ignelater luminosus]